MRGAAGVTEARHLAVGFLARVQESHGIALVPRVVDSIRLVVSELVTNARKYAPGLVLLHLRVAGGEVQVSVWDTSPELPRHRAPDPKRVGQHGLEIVLALVQRFEIHQEAAGKRITAHIAYD